jgi:hypothetical protein
MDILYLSLKLFMYFTILFVFIFVIGNMILDIRNNRNEKENVDTTKVKKVKKENWWGGIKSGKWWKKFRNNNEELNRDFLEGFTNVNKKTFYNNEFQQIILPNVDNYNLEIAIPTDQQIYPTVQGNWGFYTTETGGGFTVGVYRDGYTADGCLLKGVSEKRYKHMLERGPYVIRYEIRKNKNPNQDIKIFVNNKEVEYVENEGVSSGKLKYIGINGDLNKKTDSNSPGRRPLDYLKFIPITNEIKE